MDQIKRPNTAKSAAKGRLLLLCYYDPHGISTVIDNIGFFRDLSGFAIDIWNFYNMGPVKLPADFDWRRYDGLIIHNTLSYSPDTLEGLDADIPGGLASFPGAKILFKQDEHHLAGRMAKYIGSREMDIVFTVLEPSEWPKVYPASVVGGAKLVQMLTGYVMPWMRAMKETSADRPIDIGYRGSIQPFIFGRLAYEKRQIGDEVLRRAEPAGLRLDISSRWEDRLGGSAWTEFLSKCKATLSVESGSDLFDFDGEVAAFYDKIKQAEGEHLEDPVWCEQTLERLAPWEGKVNYRAISPRHFEASSTRTLQIMLEGRYNGIFEPGRHYFSLKRDYSNLDEAIQLVRDEPRRREITENAFAEIILNKKYWIETFVETFDQVVGELFHKEKLPRSSVDVSSGKPAPSNVLLLCAHARHLDPRIGWITDHAPREMLIHVASCDHELASDEPVCEMTSAGGLAVVGPVRDVSGVERFRDLASLQMHDGVMRALFLIDWIAKHEAVEVAEFAGTRAFDQRTEAFHWYARHFMRITESLLSVSRAFDGIDAILATDLDTLIAGCILKAQWNVPLIYDAHEFWPESDVKSLGWEVAFWRQIEQWLLPLVDSAFTVSGPLALHLSEIYHKEFVSVPNCEPLRDSHTPPPAMRQRSGGEVVFLFQGNFAPGRGIEKLVNAWPATPPEAVLWLRGPKNKYSEEFRQMAEKSGLLGSRIRFLPPVKECDLVAASAEADVGVIPYEPIISNNTYCCPNKMSQYMAAGLPILANRLDYVAENLREASCGMVVDFSDRQALAGAVAYLCEHSAERKKMGERSLGHHRDKFHWQKASQPLYEKLKEAAAPACVKREHRVASASFSNLHPPTVGGFWGTALEPALKVQRAQWVSLQSQLNQLAADLREEWEKTKRLKRQIAALKKERKDAEAVRVFITGKLVALSRSRWVGLGRCFGFGKKLPLPKKRSAPGYLKALMRTLRSDAWLRLGSRFKRRLRPILDADGVVPGEVKDASRQPVEPESSAQQSGLTKD